jgi:hypothetical protein
VPGWGFSMYLSSSSSHMRPSATSFSSMIP